MRTFRSIDEYIKPFPPSTRSLLRQLRRTIREVVPEAEEAIRYGMPTFRLQKNLVHFAAYAHHIGFYPGPAAITAFKRRLSTYQTSKGTIRLPLDRPLPLPLIRKTVQFRVASTVPGAPFARPASPARRAPKRAGARSTKR